MQDKYKELFLSNNKIVSKRCTEKWLISNNIHEEILNLTNFLDSTFTIFERVHCIIHEITSKPVCKVCGERTKINREIVSGTFRDFCSTKCSSKMRSVDHYSKRDLESAKEKRKVSMLEKYGVEFNSQRLEIKKILSDRMSTQISSDIKEKLNSYSWMEDQYIIQNKSAVDIGESLGCFYGTVIEYCKIHGFNIKQTSSYSLGEKELLDFITMNYTGEILSNTKKIINPFELDIYIPEKKLAIEFNGLYWHSSNCNSKENRERHLKKTELCESMGIQLIHIFEDEWLYKKDIVKSIILSKLGVFENRIFARKCSIKDVSKEDSKIFLEENHIQGFVSGSRSLGLYHNNSLVSLIVIGKSRFENDKEELLRFCTLKNVQVIGGFSKLLKSLGDISLISYADRRFSTGKMYGNFGKLISISKPGYFWVDKHSMKRISRFSTQKSKLSKFLKNFYPDKSETENMFLNGYRQIYDSGNYKFLFHP